MRTINRTKSSIYNELRQKYKELFELEEVIKEVQKNECIDLGWLTDLTIDKVVLKYDIKKLVKKYRKTM